MFRLISKNQPKTFLAPLQNLMPGKIGKNWPASKIPRGSNLISKMGELSNIKHLNVLYIFGFVSAASAVTACNFVKTADMAGIDSHESSKTKKHQHVSQQQLQQAYDTLKKEMGLPLSKGQLDDWDQLIFVVKAAINIKKCKEELSKIRKKEEMLLQESIASDEEVRQRAEELFKKREEELKKSYKYEFQQQVEEEISRAKNKKEQMFKELKDTAAIEREHDINMQKALMAKEMAEKFDQLRTETENTVQDIERILNIKHMDLNEQEYILQENKDLVAVRDKCRAVEAELMTEMTPGKKWMNQLCSLNSLIEVVMRAFPENNELAKVVLQTLPNEVVERGVLTEVSLKKRFEHVERVAQRLALLRNEGPYPGAMYLASYVRSMLTLQSPENPAVQPEGLNGVDNMDILCRARHCVERGDFARAVKFLDHLKGAPRSVVSGWVQEARLVLQVRNATQVLKNYSTMLIERSAVPLTDH